MADAKVREVKAFDRFTYRRSKVAVLWVEKRAKRARILYEKYGQTTWVSVSALSKYPRLRRPLAHKVHKVCRCCHKTVYIRVEAAARMARADLRHK